MRAGSLLQQKAGEKCGLELWLIRHGETDWNRERRWQGQSDPPLNELGQQQAKTLVSRLAEQTFDQIYSSDLIRAQETATLACPNTAIVAEPRLREMHFGAFEGQRWDDLKADHSETLAAWRRSPYEFRPPDGEHYQDMADRVLEWYGALPADGRIAAVVHGGVLRALLYSITGVPLATQWAFTLDNAGISIVERHRDMTLIRTVNDTAHLGNLQALSDAPE